MHRNERQQEPAPMGRTIMTETDWQWCWAALDSLQLCDPDEICGDDDSFLAQYEPFVR